MPILSEALRKGELSYAKVREVIRIAKASTEQNLVDIAKAATGAQVQKLVSA